MPRGKSKTGLPLSKHMRLAKELHQLERWAESVMPSMEMAYPLHTKPVKLASQIRAKIGELTTVMADQFPNDDGTDDFKNPYAAQEDQDDE